ncbi:MAG: copper-binding protein [Burkholderiales bacterium]|nr:copper-binding protein [Burkholderiales bacterium]
MKTPPALTLAAVLVAASTLALAQHKHGSPGTAASTTAQTEMADGEVRRVDKAKGTLLIRHGEIKSLNMSPMTMAFKLQDPKMADGLNVGDKIRFVAVQKGDDLIVTNLLKVQ